ncbi:PadR family transcriptional regulator [Paenibacillus pinisoli]|uniref:PadR family transcriptional regulator n=1 Tax=Paenibacillus pinisoli TaxID=1276110 RepID=UPI001FB49307|nr:PadR family transcriptional regulator [Paenibacillus pinisoli]
MTDISWDENEQLFVHHEDGREWSSSGRRFFSRGGVKFAVLELLTIEPMHGYQMIKHLEEQSAGTYKPSAGTIYPTLQLLSDQGLVTAKKEAGKKIFEITDDGRTFLHQEREARMEEMADDESTLHGGRRGGRYMRGGGRFMRGEDMRHPRGRHHGHAAYGRHGAVDGERGYENSAYRRGEHDEERGRGRNRRLTPAGKELFHQLKAAERAAMGDKVKAERLRVILSELREDLHKLTEGK